MAAAHSTAESTIATVQDNHDPVTGTPIWWFNHPRLSTRAMQRIDRAIHVWWQHSEAMGHGVEILMPSECHRIAREIGDGSFQRPGKPREICSVVIETGKTIYVDTRKADWRDIAADEVERQAQELLQLSRVMREYDGSELEGGAA